jgi:hypothetical protein
MARGEREKDSGLRGVERGKRKAGPGRNSSFLFGLFPL